MNFTRGDINDLPSSSTMSGPGYGMAIDTNHLRLFVGDHSDNRVLVFDLTATNGLKNHFATFILGQQDGVGVASGTTAKKMNNPDGVAYDNTNNLVYVADEQNNRVLIFDGNNLATGMPASNVLGQPLFTDAFTGNGASQMFTPRGVAVDPAHSRVYVTDTSNNRVLVFDTSGGITDSMAAMFG